MPKHPDQAAIRPAKVKVSLAYDIMISYLVINNMFSFSLECVGISRLWFWFWFNAKQDSFSFTNCNIMFADGLAM